MTADWMKILPLGGFRELIALGGPAIVALMLLSVALYSLSFHALASMRRFRGRCLELAASHPSRELLHQTEVELREAYGRTRTTLGAMVAAAPLLGLLGTVSGMSVTFAALSSSNGGKSMEALAAGISEVLLATEAGLAIALPGLGVIYALHQLTHRCLHILQRAPRART